MSTDVRKRWKPLESGNAISALPAAARLPCHRPAARAPSVRGSPPPSRLLQRPQPRAGPAAPPGRGVGAEPGPQHGEGRATPPLLRAPGVAEEALSLPHGPQVRAPGGLWRAVLSRPVPPRSGARQGGGGGEPRLGNCAPCPWAAWWVAAGRGRRGEGALRQEGKARSPGAHTVTPQPPPPRCGFVAATSDLFANMPPANREKNTSIQSSDPN